MGRQLTVEEETLRAKRLERMSSFIDERLPVLIDFAEGIELAMPVTIVRDPWRYLSGIAEFLRNQVITDDEDRIWIVTRLGYYIGELLIQKFGGVWFLNEIPDSPHFLEYVVGRFARASNPHALVAPFAVADYFGRQDIGRDLDGLLREIATELGDVR